MAETDQRRTRELSWATLLKVAAAVALIWIWRELAWLVMLLLIALIIAVGDRRPGYGRMRVSAGR